MTNDDIFPAGALSPAARELMAAAFETLLFFPGIDFTRWCQVLLKEYTEEVIDALGDDADSVMPALRDLWTDGVYTDECTGISKRYSEWAALLRDQPTVDYYRSLVDEANKQRGI